MSLLPAFISAQQAQVGMTAAAVVMKMDVQAAAGLVDMLSDAADSLAAAVAPPPDGMGTFVDVSV